MRACSLARLNGGVRWKGVEAQLMSFVGNWIFPGKLAGENSEILQLLAGEQIDGRTNKNPTRRERSCQTEKNKPRRKRHRRAGSLASHGRGIPRWKSVNGYKGQVSLALGQLA